MKIMKITHTPPDGPAQEWRFDMSRLMVAELDAIEKVTGLSGLIAFNEALNNWSASALRALIWIIQKRANPPLRYEAVDFAIADINITPEEEAAPKDAAEEPSSNGLSASAVTG